jgi:methylglyoxal synthase
MLPKYVRFWDPRLDKLNIKLVPAANPTFRVVEAYFQDNRDPEHPNDNEASESKNGIKIEVGVEDARGRALTNVRVIQAFPGEEAFALTTPAGYCDFDMSGDSSFDPNKSQSGPYSIFVRGGDKIVGLGLPVRQHVQYLIKFQQVPLTVVLDKFDLGVAAKIALANTFGIPLNTEAALAKFAIQKKLGIPLTDEIEFQWKGETYVGQMWSGGAVFCKQGDFGNIQLS